MRPTWSTFAQCKASRHGDLVPTYTDLLVKLAALALEKHPVLNVALGRRSHRDARGHPHRHRRRYRRRACWSPSFATCRGLSLQRVGGPLARPDRTRPARQAVGARKCKAARSPSRRWAPSASTRSRRSSTIPSAPSSASAASAAAPWWSDDADRHPRPGDAELDVRPPHRRWRARPRGSCRRSGAAIENPGPWL